MIPKQENNQRYLKIQENLQDPIPDDFYLKDRQSQSHRDLLANESRRMSIEPSSIKKTSEIQLKKDLMTTNEQYDQQHKSEKVVQDDLLSSMLDHLGENEIMASSKEEISPKTNEQKEIRFTMDVSIRQRQEQKSRERQRVLHTSLGTTTVNLRQNNIWRPQGYNHSNLLNRDLQSVQGHQTRQHAESMTKNTLLPLSTIQQEKQTPFKNILDLPETARKSLMASTNSGKFYQRKQDQLSYDGSLDDKLKDFTQVLNPFLKGKPTAATITDRNYQVERRTFRNTYQMDHLKNLQISLPKQDGQDLFKAGEQNLSPRLQDSQPVNPKSLIRIPKDLVLYQLSQKGDRSVLDTFLTQSDINEGSTTERDILPNKNNFQEILRRANAQTQLNRSVIAQMTRNLEPIQNEGNSTVKQFDTAITQRSQTATFKITDLLDKSFKQANADFETSKLKSIVEFYKRTVKDCDINAPVNEREIMIRNYRLHIVTDEAKELPQQDRDILGLNHGTSIYVNNSIIKPEVFHFTTSVIQDEQVLQQLIKSPPREQPKRPAKVTKKKVDEEAEDAELKMMLAQTLKVGMDNIDPDETTNLRIQTGVTSAGQMSVKTPLSIGSNDEDKAADLIMKRCQALLSTWLTGLNLKDIMGGRFQVAAESAVKMRKEILERKVTEKKPLYVKRGKNKKQFEEVPDNDFYNHLKMTVVDPTAISKLTTLMQETVKINLTSERLGGAFNNLNYRQTCQAMELMWHYYSHLDPIGLKPEELPIELFVSYEKWVGTLSRRIMHEHNSVYAEVDHKETNGQITQRIGEIVDFDAGSLKFLVLNKETGYKTWRSRMEMRLIEDPLDAKNVKKERQRAQAIIDNTVEFMKVHELILREFTLMFPYISMSEEMRQNIQRMAKFEESRIRISEMSQPLRRLMIQVEALYVFGIFKSIVMSQKQDLRIKQLLMKYNIPIETQALTYFIPEVKDKSSFGAQLAKYSSRKIKNKLCNGSSLLMTNEKFLSMQVKLAKVQEQTLSKVHLFQVQVDPAFLHIQGGEVFKKYAHQDLDDKVNTYPLNHRYFVTAQKVVAEFYNTTLKYRWCEGICQHVKNLVKSEFEYPEGTKLEEHNIDNALKKVFFQIKLTMQSVLRESLVLAISQYLEFLLGFQLRDADDMRESQAYRYIQRSKEIKLPSTEKYRRVAYLKEDIRNDMELVPLKKTAFVKMGITVDTKSGGSSEQVVSTKGGGVNTYKPITKPDLNQVKKDLMAVVNNMHRGLKGVDRVDKLVFPLLHMPPPTNYINVPSLTEEEEFVSQITGIDLLIEVSVEKTSGLLEWLQSYTMIFQRKQEEIIMDLKKRTYVLQNEHLLDDSDEDSLEDSLQTESNYHQNLQLDVQSASSKESIKIVNKAPPRFQPRQQTNLKYQKMPEFPPGSEAILKSLEIDRDIFMDELFGLRDEYWDVQEDIEASYDFGLFYLECGPLKDKIAKHIKKLIEHLENFQKKDFMSKMDQIQNEIRIITNKLEEHAESIDEVMMLLDYIEVVKRPESKVDELSEYIQNLKTKMEFILDLEITLEGDSFRSYLNLLRWPNQFKEWLEVRRTQLLSTKESLFAQMNSEKVAIYDKIKEIQKRIGSIKRLEGLIQISLLDKTLWGMLPQIQSMKTSVANQKQFQQKPLSLEEKESPTMRRIRTLEKKGLQKSNIPKQHLLSRLKEDGEQYYEEEPVADPPPSSDDYMVKRETALAAFLFMAKEIEWDDFRFEPDVIEEVSDLIEVIKEDYEDVERMTIQINKREMLLAIDKTDFKELRMTYDELKPVSDLWQCANKFNQAFPGNQIIFTMFFYIVWFEGKFENLDSEQIDSNVNEWANELKRLSKSSVIQGAAKQKELLEFIQKSIGQFKFYIPMLKSLRTKGLSLRHWRMIGAKLGFSFDPATMTLWKLINMKMHEESRLAIIRSISEIATKEHALLTGIESLDRDIRSIEFTLVPHRNTPILIVMKLPEVQQSYEEFQTRLSILRSNPFMKNFYEKMHEIDRIIKLVVELSAEWQVLQRHWMYLQEIFSLPEIQKQLESHCKKFQKVNEYIKGVTKGFELAVRVHVGFQREVVPHMLQKMIADCESIGKGLGEFLEFKREKFPRLYFLSNEEIVEIFGLDKLVNASRGSKNAPKRTFISNLFEGVDTLKFRENDLAVIGLKSKEGEEVPFIRAVQTENNPPDVWLKNFDIQMTNTLRFNILSAYATFHKETDFTQWIGQWLGQSLIVSIHLWFTFRVEELLNSYTDRIQYKIDKQRAELEALNQRNDELYLEESVEESKAIQPGSIPNSETPAATNTEDQISKKLESSLNEADKSSKESLNTFVKQIPNTGELDEDQEQEEKERKLKEWQNKQAMKLQNIYLEEYVDSQTISGINNVISTGQSLSQSKIDYELTFAEQLEDYKYEIQNILDEFLLMVRSQQKRLNRVSTINIITVMINLRDIFETIVKEGLTDIDSFTWQMQIKLKFKDLTKNLMLKQYFDSFGKANKNRINYTQIDIEIDALKAQWKYSFEYLGNVQRLVITPLTERCLRSLLIALNYCYGGAPEGPVGTGKTETVKELSKCLGKTCFMMNCSSNFEYLSAIRFFKGLASTGFWVCFDEFNRMDPHLISMLSQVIIAIQGAIRKQTPTIVIETTKINIRADCAIFITLNPKYAGRNDLPQNLKNMFRTVSMVIPDTSFIAQILLYSAGFEKAKKLAKKIISTLQLAEKTLFRQHYDFGLRAVKTVVGIAERIRLQYHGIVENELSYFLSDQSLDMLTYRQASRGYDPQTFMILQFLKERRAPSKTSIEPTEADIIKRNEALSIKDEDPLLVRGPDVKTLLELQKLNEQRRRGGVGMLSGSKSRVFEDLLGGKEHLAEIGIEMLLAQLGLEPSTKRYDANVLEEKMILKALRDFNEAKFGRADSIIVEGIIKDVFNVKKSPDTTRLALRDDQIDPYYGNLKACLEWTFSFMKLNYSSSIIDKALLLYELLKAKHGIILLGDACTGKSTLLKMLENALNKSSLNEMQVLMDQRYREKLNYISKEEYDEIIAISKPRPDTSAAFDSNSSKPYVNRGGNNLLPNLSQISGLTTSTQANPALQKKKTKRGGRDGRYGIAQTQITYNGVAYDTQLIEEVKKRIKLSKRDIKEIKAQLVIKGVVQQRVNPKAMPIDELFGKYNSEVRLWQEGIFTEFYREFSKDNTSKKKWLILDGNIDSMWAENLNSILDDNKKMIIPNGESIYLSNGMSLIMETDSLNAATPATISRCGLIYMEANKYVKPKHLFNTWLRTLPKNLLQDDAAVDIENYCNLLIPEAFSVLENAKIHNQLVVNQIYTDPFSIIKTFLRLMNAFLHDYLVYGEKLSANKVSHSAVSNISSAIIPAQAQNPFRKMMTLDTRNTGVKLEKLNSQQNEKHQPQGNAEKEPEKKDEREILFQQSLRIACNSFLQNEMRMENAMKFQAMFIEASIVFSLIWSFGTLLDERGRIELDRRIKEKIEPLKTDFVTFQKWKKKQQTQNQQQEEPQQMRGKTGFQDILDHKKNEDNAPQIDLTEDFTTDTKSYVPPKFMSEIHTAAGSLFDYYFSFDMSCWHRFSADKELNNSLVNYHHLQPSLKRVHNIYVPTLESTKYGYLIECLIISQQPTLILGKQASGKSELLRNSLLHNLFKYSDKYFVEHLTFSAVTDSRTLKQSLERRLVQEVGNQYNSKIFQGKLINEEGQNSMQRYMRPEIGKNMLIFIDDLHMPLTLANSSTSLELVRDFMLSGGWHMVKGLAFRRIFDTFIFATATDQQNQTALSKRLTNHFAILGMDSASKETFQSIFKVYCDLVVTKWGSDVQQFAGKICDVMVEFYEKIKQSQLDVIKRSPSHSHFHFDWQDFFKVCSGLSLIEPSYLKKRQHLAKLVYHEMSRVFCDQISVQEGQDQLNDLIRDICTKRFGLQPSVQDEKIPQEIYFSYFNPEVESFYFEIESVERSHEVVEKILLRYNDQPQFQPLSLVFFKELNKILMKITRAISLYQGNLIIVALKGSGIQTLQKLACFSQQLVLKQFKLGDVYAQREEWLEDFKALLKISAQEDRGIVYQIDQSCIPLTKEGRSFNQNFLADIYCLMKNNFHTEIYSGVQLEFDILLGKVFESIESELLIKGTNGGGSQAQKASRNKGGDIKTQSTNNQQSLPTDRSNSVRQSNEEKTVTESTTKTVNPIQKYPFVRAENYLNMLKKTRCNIKTVFNLSPTGDQFSTIIRSIRHTIIPKCTLVWVKEFPREALMELAYKNYIEIYEVEERSRFAQARDQHRRKLLGEKLVSTIAVDEEYSSNLMEMSPDDSQKQIKEMAMARIRNSPPNAILESFVQMYFDVRSMAQRFYQDQKQTLYYTPKHFLNLFANYRRLFLERQKSVQSTKRRYESGLAKIIEAQDRIQASHKQLELMTPQLQGRQVGLIESAVKIETRFSEIEGLRDQLKRDEFYLEDDLRRAELIKEECDVQLAKVMPALNEAINSIQAIPRQDISEIKVMKTPPRVIKLIMKALCILLGIKPIVKKRKDGSYKPSYWLAAQSQELLGNPQLTQFLIDFDRSKISLEQMKTVETDIMVDPDYTFENAFHASKAAPAFYDWVQAVRDYFYVFREIEPRRDAYMLADIQYRHKKKETEEKREDVRLAEIEVQKLRNQQSELELQVDILRDELRDCKERKRRADTLMRSLATEKQKWIVCTRVLSHKFQNVAGDVILAAAYITLLAGFTKKYRLKLLNQWVNLLLKAGFHVSSSENFSLVDLFGDSVKIRSWTTDYGLPSDDHSLSNALVMEKSLKVTICIDPQMQANNWLRRLYEEAGIIVVRQTDTQFVKTVEYSIKEGKPLLIENIGDALAPSLQDLIESYNLTLISTTKKDHMLKFDNKVHKCLSSFKLFMTTPLERPHFSVDIQNLSIMINFQITIESLHQQLLTMIIGTERKELEERFMENSKQAFEHTKSLREIENAILELLKQETKVLLGDDVLIRTLNESRTMEQLISSKLKVIENTSIAIKKTCDVYSGAARRASMMYFVIIQMHEISPMFRFSLAHFMKSFQKALQIAIKLGGRSLQIISSGPPPKGASKASRRAYEAALLLKQEEHMQNLLNSFISDLFRKVTAALVPQNKELFTFQLIFKVLEGQELLDKTQLFRFLLGLKNKANITSSKAKLDDTYPEQNQLPWLTHNVWKDLKRLESFSPFSTENLSKHILSHKQDWTSFYHLPETYNETEPFSYSFEMLPNNSLIRLEAYQEPLSEPSPLLISNLLQRRTTIKDVDTILKKIERKEFTRKDSSEGEKSSKQSMIAEEEEEQKSQEELSALEMSEESSQISANADSLVNNEEIWQVSMSEDGKNESSSDIDNESHHQKLKKKKTLEINADEKEAVAERERIKANQYREEKIAMYLLSASPLIMYTPIDNQEQKNKDQQIETEKQRMRDSVAEAMILLSVIRCLKPEMVGQYIIKLLSPLANLNRILDQNNINLLKPKRMSLRDQEILQTQGQQPQATFYVGQTQQKVGTLQKTQLMKTIKDACDEANYYTPIFLVINGSINVHQTIVEFQRSFPETYQNCRLHYMSMGKGLEKKVEDRIINASQSGDWLLLENLHLVLDWLPKLEDILNKLQTSSQSEVINQRFRLWLSSIPLPSFPENLLKLSIKISLQPPSGVKQILERLISKETSESLIQAGKIKGVPLENCQMHKNLFFSLMYLHAMLESRKKYGQLGWNISYQFDQGDFEISANQLSRLVLAPIPELVGQNKFIKTEEEQNMIPQQMDNREIKLRSKLEAILNYMKFLVGQANYAGKIQRTQDMTVVRTLISDLLNSDVAFNKREFIAPDMFKSNYGFPPLDLDCYSTYNDFVQKLPDVDNELIFGFNPLIEKSLQVKSVTNILDKMLSLKKRRKFYMSPLDAKIREDNDYKVLQLTNEILNQITRVESNISELANKLNKVNNNVNLENPIQVFITREVQQYHSLLQVITKSIKRLNQYINCESSGSQHEHDETLQDQVYRGITPMDWLRQSYSSSRTSLPSFIEDLIKRCDFILDFNSIIRKQQGLGTKPLWLGGYFDPNSFLSCLQQVVARKNSMELSQVSLHLEIHNKNNDYNVVCLINGLYLEGAQLNLSSMTLEEPSITSSEELYIEFPTIAIIATLTEKKSMHQKIQEMKIKQEMEKLITKAKEGANQFYKCPIYKNELRLQEREGMRYDIEPLTSIDIKTVSKEPSFWIKRSVAIILDINQ